MLNPKQKYLQIAFNRSLDEVLAMIDNLPISERIIIETGYPLIKNSGVYSIAVIKNYWRQKALGINSGGSAKNQIVANNPDLILLKKIMENLKPREASNAAAEALMTKKSDVYIVADLKCMDRAFIEVEAAASAGASAATCLGLAPIETIDAFIKECADLKLDSYLDMLNIEYPFEILGKLKIPPRVIMLHRGVDEFSNREKEMPYDQIERIKSVYDSVLIAVAGGETLDDVMDGSFNNADILIVWKLFNENPEKIATLTKDFLRKIK